MNVARLARRTGGAVALAGCLALGGLAAPAFAVPPGNNGTIKIDGVAFDDHPNNEPHVGCTFQVDFYGYDEGDLEATVTFRAHPPTGERQDLLTDTVFIGEDDKSGGGSEEGLDASETYTLDFTGIDPHPKQGFHVKVTINAEGSKGSDVKHKVFWVECAPKPSPTPTDTPTHEPTKKPTHEPTDKPTHEPTDKPTHEPTDKPTHEPTDKPTHEPTDRPTHEPTHKPTHEPTHKPTHEPTDEPTEEPEAVPTAVPAGAEGTGGGSGGGLFGLALTASGAVAGTALMLRRRFLHDS